jgi:hypothetical protein
MAKDTRTFDDLVNENHAYMIEELCKGKPWHSIVYIVMDRTLMWRKNKDKEDSHVKR